MRTTFGHDVAGIAAGLDMDTIHVWLLNYRRSEQREPLCALLGIYLGLAADAIELVDGEYGRPVLAAPWNQLLNFNWSHSADKAIVVVARGIAPGIDIERIRPRPRAMQLAERFFHPEETAALIALDEQQREHAFLQLWTAKEAVLKALGRGVAFGLHRLRLTVAPVLPGLLWLDGEDPAQWQLHRVDVASDYIASVAWRGTPRTIHRWTLADGD